jgi:hypothetical protein
MAGCIGIAFQEGGKFTGGAFFGEGFTTFESPGFRISQLVGLEKFPDGLG